MKIVHFSDLHQLRLPRPRQLGHIHDPVQQFPPAILGSEKSCHNRILSMGGFWRQQLHSVQTQAKRLQIQKVLVRPPQSGRLTGNQPYRNTADALIKR